MTERVRLGVIGTSWYTDGVLLPVLGAHPQAALVAVCGRNRARAEEVASKHGIPSVFTDYRQMYEHGGLDAVVVSSPDDLHYAMTIDALDAGLHVLCEKPMALTLADAQAMLAKAEAARVKHMVNFSWRTMPVYQYMKELIADGYLGDVYQCAVSFDMGLGRDAQYHWHFDRRRANGVLGDLGSHMADLARWLIGDIASVSALLNTFVPRPGPDGGTLDPANDAATLAVRFANGAQGTIQVSFVTHVGDRGMQQQVAVHGAQGTLESDSSVSGGSELRGARGDEPQILPLPIPERFNGSVDPSQPPFIQLVQRLQTLPVGPRTFIDAILDDHPAVPSFADGVKAQAFIAAALRSAETGCAAGVD